MSQRKEYIVTLHRHEDLDSFYQDMETPGGTASIPERAIDVHQRRPISRNTHYLLTDEEAELIRQDSRVWAVEVPIDQQEFVVRSPSWTQNNTFAPDLDWQNTDKNWALVYSTSSAIVQGLDNLQKVTATVTRPLSGKNVDIVNNEAYIKANHAEFAANVNGKAPYRTVQTNWYGYGLPGPFGETTFPYPGTISAHATECSGLAAGNTQGWAKDGNIHYGGPGIDYIRVWHNWKKTNAINPDTGVPNPTIVHESANSRFAVPVGSLGSITYRGSSYAGPWTAINPSSLRTDPYTWTNGTVTLGDLGFTPLQRSGNVFSVFAGRQDVAYNADLEDAINDGIIMVFSAGNYSMKIDVPGGPDYNNNFTVSGTTYYQNRNEFTANVLVSGNHTADRKVGFNSDTGPGITMWAPGEYTITATANNEPESKPDPRGLNGDRLLTASGTSFSCPNNAGFFACLAELWPTATQAQILTYMQDKAITGRMVSTLPDNNNNRQALKGATTKTLFFPQMVFSIVPNVTTLNPGQSVTYTITITNAPDGSRVYLKETGSALAGDFADGELNLTVIVNGGTATVTRTLSASFEGTRTSILSLRTGGYNGNVQATSPTVSLAATPQNNIITQNGRELLIFPYRNGVQSFKFPEGYGNDVKYWMWGGGGAAGGSGGSSRGGSGAAGTLITGSFRALAGDEVQIYVGQGGQPGLGRLERAITNATIPGNSSTSQPNPSVFGSMPDPSGGTKWPVYSGALTSRTYSRWGSFLNTYAVSNIPPNTVETEEVYNTVYFPKAGNYSMIVGADNSLIIEIFGKTYTAANNFISEKVFTITCPGEGNYTLRYVLTNAAGTSGNPAGAAILITSPTQNSFGNLVGSGGLFAGRQPNTFIWHTRLGPNLDFSPGVPVFMTPLVPGYIPGDGDYDFNGLTKAFAFLSQNTNWNEEDLALLGLTFEQVNLVQFPTQISCRGNANNIFGTGYYRFNRGQTWQNARYSWLGDVGLRYGDLVATSPNNNSGALPTWTNRSYLQPGRRQTNASLATWQLPEPSRDQIFIVGYYDSLSLGNIPGVATVNGSDNLRWLAESSVGTLVYNGGSGGRSAVNIQNKKYNYFGGFGGHNSNVENIAIGANANGGGGGGGGASLILLKRGTGQEYTFNVTPASIGLMSNWQNSLDAATWFNEVGKPSGINLTVQNCGITTMPTRQGGPGRPETLKAIQTTGAANSRAFCNNNAKLNISGLDINGVPKPFTIESWVYPENNGGGGQGYGGEIINKDWEYEVARWQDGRIAIAVDWGQGAWESVYGRGWMFTDVVMPLGASYLVSVVFTTNQDCLLYINGVLRWQCSRDGYLDKANNRRYICYRYKPVRVDQPLVVGSRPGGLQNWQGFIGDVRLWTTALSQEEILRNYYAVNYSRTVRQDATVGVAIAGGGGGGGGARSGAPGTITDTPYNGADGSNSYKFGPAASYALNSIGAGLTGTTASNNVPGAPRGIDGGGGGGGGCDGGDGGFSGGSQTQTRPLTTPKGFYVIAGRGGDGGGGGGGGAGDVLTGNFQLSATQVVIIGGSSESEGGESRIVQYNADGNPINLVVAGPGGRGGTNSAGQPGGVIGEGRTPSYGGSGGGGGSSGNNYQSGGNKNQYKGKVAGVTVDATSLNNVGLPTGPASLGAPGGGGGGAGGSGSSGDSNGGGRGGPAKTVTLSGASVKYRLGAGGGGGASMKNPGINNIGLGGTDDQGNMLGGSGNSGSGSGVEFIGPITLESFKLPAGVTNLFIEGVGAGGGGGKVSGPVPLKNVAVAAGGGGAGGYLPRTSYEVKEQSTVQVVLAAGGAANGNAGETRINLVQPNGSSLTIRLAGGRAGSQASGRPAPGGAGGAPNGATGGASEIITTVPAYARSGDGAASPYGEGGSGAVGNQGKAREIPTSAPKTSYGAGGGGGIQYYAGNLLAPGTGAPAYVKIEWDAKYNILDARPNSASGGGGAANNEGDSGRGGSGFAAICYEGPPIYTQRTLNGRVVVPPKIINSYTVHEFTESCLLEFVPDSAPGEILRGNGTEPAGRDIQGFVPGTAQGGYGNVANIYPVTREAWSQILRQHGVWFSPNNFTGVGITTNFITMERTYYLDVTETARFQFECSVSYGAKVYVDDGLIFELAPPEPAKDPNYWNTGFYRKGQVKLQAGVRKLTYIATARRGQYGGFGLKISQENVNNILFDSRNPPRSTLLEPTGGNGLVILEVQSGVGAGAFIKVDNNWTKVTDSFVKVGGQWKNISGAWVKVGDKWQALMGGDPIVPTITTAGFGGPGRPTVTAPAPAPPPSGGGGGGGGCKIICNKLAEMGFFDPEMNDADQRFGMLLRDTDPDAYNGYLRWAGPVVDLLEGGGSATFRKIVFPWLRDEQARRDLQIKIVAHYLDGIARPWAEEMAYRMKARGYEKSNPAGRFIMNVGLPMCRAIAKFGRGKSMPMWAKTAVIWGTTTVLLCIITVISGTNNIIKRIKKFLKRD